MHVSETINGNQPESLHQIIRDALRFAAVEPTPNGAIDILGDALARVGQIATELGLR